MAASHPPVSRLWIVLGIVIFTAFELLLGGVVAQMLEGRQVSHMLSLRLELALGLSSYFLGGLTIGVVSPGLRLIEPAIAAAASVVFTFFIAFFTPITFFAADPGRMFVGGAIAFCVALFGAHLGERLTGK